MEEIAQKLNLELKTWGMQSGFIIAYHPLDYAKTLAQIGYEPYRPVESWFFGSTYLGLPNMFQYVRYIKSVDGYFGLYRGLVPRLCGSTVSAIVYNTLSKVTSQHSGTDVDRSSKGEEEVQLGKVSAFRSGSWTNNRSQADASIPAFVKKTVFEIVCVTGSSIAAHPFHVIAVRTMAQFVGRESKYTSLWDSIREIYSGEGIKGFFSGLIPRLVGDVIYITVSATVVYLAVRNFGKSKAVDQASGMTGNMIASSFSYPFQVVANTMIVNNSGLAIGNAPYTCTYDSWLSAYSVLKSSKQIKRGSSLVGRSYTGPTILVDGKLQPFGFYFGPTWPAGTGYQTKIVPLNYPSRFPQIMDKTS